VAFWLKIGYFNSAQEADSNYWLKRDWVNDSPGRLSGWWRSFAKPKKGQVYPTHGPQYAVGDRLVVYITDFGVCPAILEVVGEPHWDPDWVDARTKDGDGDDWAVVTPVKGLWAMKVSDAPPIEKIGVAKARVQEKGHVTLTTAEYEEAERLIAKRKGKKWSAQPVSSSIVSLEEGRVEGYEVQRPATVQKAERREARLVTDFAATLEAQGDEVMRNKVLPKGGAHPLYSDIFNCTRKQLIEAKAGSSRGDIRMAIGQLADYERYVPSVLGRAVLLDARPHRDLLALLKSQEIAAIWRQGDGFADNAGGRFV
jgi:hypothetical protein